MVARDSVAQGSQLRPGVAAVIILLAVLLVAANAIRQPLEVSFYDWLQRHFAPAGSARVVIIDTSSIAAHGNTPWASRDFPRLLRSVSATGARLIVPADPPPPAFAMPDARRLQQLQALEQATSDSQTDPEQHARQLQAFAHRLDELRAQAEQQIAVTAAAHDLHNLVLQIPVAEEGSKPGAAQACTNDSLRMELASRNTAVPMPKVSLADSPGNGLCNAARAIGHGQFWSDSDGYVRREQLAVQAGAVLLPAVSLAAAIAAANEGNSGLRVSRDGLAMESGFLRTDADLSVLTRFYGDGGGGSAPSNESGRGPPAFLTIRAADILAGRTGSALLASRIVVLGDMQPGAPAGVPTPVNESMPIAVLVATNLSNMLQRDYLVRPGWLPWIEAAMILAIAVLLATVRQRLPNRLFGVSILMFSAAAISLEVWLMLDVGVWVQAVSSAGYALLGGALLLAFDRQPAQGSPSMIEESAHTPDLPAAQLPPSQDGLDLAFSVLRQQPPSDHVKSRLYEISVAHVRQRDLAKAERVLRHLASIDPHYRNVTEKLQKLAGMRADIDKRDVRGDSAGPPAGEPAAASAPTVRKALGRYEIEGVLGQGAMATVYLGRDTKINRRVAIKTIALAEEFSDAELETARNQFVREAESAGRLNHPAIIAVYDVGEDDDIAYLAMEYFPGKSLAQHAHSGGLLPPKKVMDLVSRAADGLHYAHGQRVVHRDIKPANLLYDADSDTIKITDFGIARLTDASRTKTGIVLGTPSYMSPEQLSGAEVTSQSDIFSLGITLYQLLAGAPPFRADSIPRLMQRIAKEKHEPIRSLRPDLPPEIDDILDRALEKNPDERFPSARAMALALKDCCTRFSAANALRA